MFSQEWRRFVSEAEFGSASSWAERKKRCRGKTEERKERPDENPTILLGGGGGKAGRSAARDALSAFFSRFLIRILWNSTRRRGEIFANFSKRPRGVGWVILEKNNKEGFEEREGRQGFRLLNEINEKQRSAGGFNPL